MMLIEHTLTRFWLRWRAVYAESLRHRRLAAKTLAKLAHLKLASAFARWRDLTETALEQRANASKALAKMLHSEVLRVI